MKKTIIIEILLLFILSILLMFTILHFMYAASWFDVIRHDIEQGFDVSSSYKYATERIIEGLFALLACIDDIAVMVVIALKDLNSVKSFVNKLHTKNENKKNARKQKRIEKLQAKIDALHGDDKN